MTKRKGNKNPRTQTENGGKKVGGGNLNNTTTKGVTFFQLGDSEDESSSRKSVERSSSERSEVRRRGMKGKGTSSNGDYFIPPSGRPLRPVPSVSTLNRLDRQKIVLWRRPLTTLRYAFLELLLVLKDYTLQLWGHRRIAILVLTTGLLMFCAYTFPGPHQFVIKYMEKKLVWSAYWVGLGILSSVGLGTGLHTFLLYLGPHIASVTVAAYECDSLNFPEPPYPTEIICPYGNGNGANATGLDMGASTVMEGLATTAVSLWAIMSKVRLESFMWGAGTALGELPPFFMARAARISGEEPDDEEYREFMEFIRLQEEYEGVEQQHSWSERVKGYMERLLQGFGFWGILLCASVPNPLFDLAGITCGHFLIPFWTFFGATLIGKAIVKMHIQKLFVIVTFSERHVEHLISMIKYIPKIGPSLQVPFKEYLTQQKVKMHRKPGEPVATKAGWLQMAFEGLVFFMVAYFLLSIINSLAQSYHKRQYKQLTSQAKQL